MLLTKKFVALKAAASSVFLGLLACGKVDQKEPASEVKVTNGLPASEEFPSVIMLQFQTAQGSAICTGTFVNDSQVVTAAHCVHDLIEAGAQPSAISFVRKDKKGASVRVSALAMEKHPDYQVEEGKLNEYDLAVVSFPRGSAPGTTPLFSGRAKEGQEFTIVGFGLNNYAYGSRGEQTGNGSGVKRKGNNRIAEVSDGMIRFYGVPTASDKATPLGQDSASGSGDSGGPLFIKGALAATTAGGGLAQARDEQGRLVTVKVSNYIDLHQPANEEFLKSALVSAPGW